MKTKKYFSLHIVLLSLCGTINAADLIIFSYNRPLQLEALLHSITTHVEHAQSVSIIYRTKGESFNTAYEELKTSWPSVKFYQQHNPPADFKPLLLELITQSPSAYICFGVDDIILTDTIDMNACVQALQKTDAYGFYLRLGKNITYSYNYNISLIIPEMTPIEQDVYRFSFTGNKSYWAYPNTVDMTVYKKDDILPALKEMKYSSPNTLEALWNRQANLEHNGLCFSHSKMVNAPLNIVQENWHSKHDDAYSPEELLNFWQQGLRIDIAELHTINNNSAHITYEPVFIQKDLNEA